MGSPRRRASSSLIELASLAEVERSSELSASTVNCCLKVPSFSLTFKEAGSSAPTTTAFS